MAIKRVWIEEGCTACGLCVDICPEVFTLEDEATVIKGVYYTDYEARTMEAADNCPVGIIKFSE